MNGANVKVYSRAKDGLEKLSTNFKVNEFACPDGSDPIFVSPELVDGFFTTSATWQVLISIDPDRNLAFPQYDIPLAKKKKKKIPLLPEPI